MNGSSRSLLALCVLCLCPGALGVTCDVDQIWVSVGQCHVLCCGSNSCNCIQRLIDEGQKGSDNTTRIDTFKFCQYVSCLYESVEGCPDEVDKYSDVEIIYNYTAVQPSGILSANGQNQTRIEFCNSMPCHWRDYNKFVQCISVLDCGQNATQQCSDDCVTSMLRCMNTSSCLDLYSSKESCVDAQSQGGCPNLCDALYPPTAPPTPVPTPAPPGGGGSNSLPVLIGAAVGGFVLLISAAVAAVWWHRRQTPVMPASITVVQTAEEGEIIRGPSEPVQHGTMNGLEPLPSPRDGTPGMHSPSPSPNPLPNPFHPSIRSHGSHILNPSVKSDTSKAPAFIIHALQKGRWQRSTLLGRGQFGSVYLALLPQGQALAVKIQDASNQDEEDTMSYLKEITTMRSLDHVNIVKYYFASYDQDEKQICIFMEYVPGGSLAKLVRTMDDRLSEGMARVYTTQILCGLEYLHSNKIIHRDIKGDNVLIDTAGGTCKISDFGSSKQIQGTVAGTVQNGTIAGTPNWMAPEVITNAAHGLGQLGDKVDVWSVGCTVVELLNRGKPPWPQFSSHWAAIYHIAQSTEMPEGIPEDLSANCRDFVTQCLIRDPVKRPNATECLAHPWVAETSAAAVNDGDSIESPDPADVDDAIGELLERNGKKAQPPGDTDSSAAEAAVAPEKDAHAAKRADLNQTVSDVESVHLSGTARALESAVPSLGATVTASRVEVSMEGSGPDSAEKMAADATLV